MGLATILSLYRCSSTEKKMSESNINYFVTDYFDGIKVEFLDENATLATCMGIKRDANEKEGVSHQRYCLVGKEDSESNIFKVSSDLPVLTVIQIFINPDIYQADSFQEGNKEITCENCMKKVEQCIKTQLCNTNNMQWKLYRLLTAGDFAIVIRSKTIHEAYDVSTLVRSIHMTVDGESKGTVFFSYSISGVLHKEDGAIGGIDEIEWGKYLEAKDEVHVRVEYSQAFRNGNFTEEDEFYINRFLEEGFRLWGRYDHWITFTPQEFQALYPYIREFKFSKLEITGTDIDLAISDKVKCILWMMKNGYIAYINERLFLRYESDYFLTKRPVAQWQLRCSSEWVTLYERNYQKINQIKVHAISLEQKLEKYYQSARNLKEYVRLVGRFCRILYEINQLQELRVSAANLLLQIEAMVESVNSFLEFAEKNVWERKEIADYIEESLRRGIAALEIFMRYARNINLQTLQTQNYDLQTNVCMIKVLLAYSQFLQPFVGREDREPEKTYYLSRKMYPIIVPNMCVKDLSVSVLFNITYPDADLKAMSFDKNQRLMVVYTPTFAFLCETCFLLPAVFHEIAHQFRYESREIRNACLKRYILKTLILSVVLELLDDKHEYRFMDEYIVKNLVNEIYSCLDEKVSYPQIQGYGLQEYKMSFTYLLEKFVNDILREEKKPRTVIMRYLDRTKMNVLVFDDAILDVLQEIENDLKLIDSSSGNKEKLMDNLRQHLEKLVSLQQQQILDKLNGLYMQEKVKFDRCEANEVEEGTLESLQQRLRNNSKNLFEFYQKNESVMGEDIRQQLRNLLKKYHNVGTVYDYCQYSLSDECFDECFENQKIFSELCVSVYQIILERLEEFQKDRDSALKWDTIALTSEELEAIIQRIKLEKKEGMEARIRAIFARYEEGGMGELADTQIELYREITSDLFMCAIMGLDAWGYLVVVAENFVFRKSTEHALYSRVCKVLECLVESDFGEREFNSKNFTAELTRILRKELQMLMLKSKAVRGEDTDHDISEWDFPEMEAFLNEFEGVPMSTTQAWIIRIYKQITYIIYNISQIYVSKEEVGEEEIWNDISGERSYIKKRDELQKILKNGFGGELCADISEILNSPARYFETRKSLLYKEMQFVLKYYEENCRYIFKQENEGM